MTKNADQRKQYIEHLLIDGNRFYKISDSGDLRPFFMSIVSDSDHWMFISSNGGLTAGRKNSDFALFPYYTDDKITESADITGSKSIFIINDGEESHLWEPFSYRYEGMYEIQRNLYKSSYGNKIIFEEINLDLQLTFRYQWNLSNTYGFIKRSTLINSSQQEYHIDILDGIQNIMPYGVSSDLQNAASNLVDAYKRSELHTDSGLGIYALSAIIVDKAEPSEALKANIAWSLGLDNTKHLVSSLQLQRFREEGTITQEDDVKAEKGAYFINAEITLTQKEEKEWLIIADVNKSHTKIIDLIHHIKHTDDLYERINQKIKQSTKRLIQLVASADGLQLSDDKYRDSRHYSNVLFNIMRGGIFDNNYEVEKWDYKSYLKQANEAAYQRNKHLIADIDDKFTLFDLRTLAEQSDDPSFQRLTLEYLPLRFSRRHGDPSRPWNKFSINTLSEDGEKILDYEGNWRDIFQNWEALAISFPEFTECMITKFLNATTFDGYNPYRVNKDGFDWEVSDPEDPWAYIGYWGDHQIIYLLKFLEIMHEVDPHHLKKYWDKEIYAYANVPYIIKSYEDIVRNPKDTIVFDEVSDAAIRSRREHMGADGALLSVTGDTVYHVNFIEKILATLLSKLSNYVPEGGIWMNTQRPEWNDANNALVGNGISMITLCYIHRFLVFLKEHLATANIQKVAISEELLSFYEEIKQVFSTTVDNISNLSNGHRKDIVDRLGKAGSNYRNGIYEHGFSGKKDSLTIADILTFIDHVEKHIKASIKVNKRSDHLYHAYNLLSIHDDSMTISHLSEMLEGQVAVLSAKLLSSEEALSVLDGMKGSDLFRDDQYSYLLYPNKALPRFLEKNNIPAEDVGKSSLLTQLVADGNINILTKDINGGYHFNGNFKNADDLAEGLSNLSKSTYGSLIEAERESILALYEKMFNHKAFTGRSGTFYGYEGLGSIYWHMVSKLQLAVQECSLKAIEEDASPQIIGRLLEHYYEINEGIGVHKSPQLYGAFPTDPYSHTPGGKGAQQPGMTGQVKEDILSRFGELGVFIQDGCLHFHPCLLRADEFIPEPKTFRYVTVTPETKKIAMPAYSLCFTICQVPVRYRIGSQDTITIFTTDGSSSTSDGHTLEKKWSEEIMMRSGKVEYLDIEINKEMLK